MSVPPAVEADWRPTNEQENLPLLLAVPGWTAGPAVRANTRAPPEVLSLHEVGLGGGVQ